MMGKVYGIAHIKSKSVNTILL